MLTAKTNWKLKNNDYDEGRVHNLAIKLDCSEIFIKLCLQRGLDTEEKINQFTMLEQPIFHDPFLMHDMQKGTDRIKKAIENGEEIVVYGDYDADGITSTAILMEVLEVLGGNAAYYLPNRFLDGYGPNVRAFEELIKQGNQLIITCDNGVAGHEAIERAAELGVDVIITDHHELPDTLPDAYAVIHPRHPEGNYPFGDLSGAGVALKLAAALLERVPDELFDLAAIGTVADLVSLRDENRWIVKTGIQYLQNTERIGLQLLYEKAGVRAENLDEETIGFILGPRLNALGRLGDAAPGVELLLSFEEERLEELVELIQHTNGERQELVQEIFHSALEKMKATPTLPAVLVLGDESWHEGVLGIVASRIVEETGRPTLLLQYHPETGVAKGSARSIDSLNMFAALSSCSNLLTKFGGHHMAAGMSLPIKDVPRLSEQLNRFAAPLESEIQKGERVEVDEILPLKHLTIDFLKEIELLKPFGTGNEKPIFGIKDVLIQNVRPIGAENRHLKLQVGSGEYSLDIIAFNKGKLAARLNERDKISAIGEVKINTWRDISKPQMELRDIKSDTVQYFDRRSSKFSAASLEVEQSVYLFFNRRIFEKYSVSIPEHSAAVLLEGKDSIPSFSAELEHLVLFDCPTNLKNMQIFLKDHPFSNYHFYCYPAESVFSEGMPGKQDFADLYRYIRQHQNMDIRGKLNQFSQFVGINKNVLIFMLSVFLEAKFVTINNGILNPIANPEKKNLEETEAFQNRLQKIEAEKLFIYSPFSDVISWIKG